MQSLIVVLGGGVMSGRTGLVFDHRYMEHNTGLALVSAPVAADSIWEPQPHVASPQLVGRVHRLLERSGTLAGLTQIPGRQASIEDVLRVHTPEHVANLRTVCLNGGGDVGEFAPASPETYDVALLSAGGGLAAIDAVMAGEVRNAYALVRPPGHHSTPDKAMGFCFVNNVAIGACYAQARHGLKRVAIVDWDVHHGNGTQAAFYSDPSVLFISLHQEDWYPIGSGAVDHIGEGAGEGYTINIPLPAGTGNAGYLSAFDRIVLPAIRAFAPELILVSAGQDPSGVDPMARMSVSSNGFREFGARMAGLADEVCDGRLVAFHEGGYNQGYAPVCTWAAIEGLSGIRTGHEDPFEVWLGAILPAVEIGPAAAHIDRVAQTHAERWGLA